MKVKILISDPLDRWKIGDIGTLSENNSTKYDYFVNFDFPPIKTKLFGKEMIIINNFNYYFFSHEVEIIND